MFANPFSPVFGGKPDVFFGRKDILARFDSAMLDRGSEDRALFITGNRGSGKTALLEQLSLRAGSAHRKVVDVSAENAVGGLLKQLFPFDEVSRTVAPTLEVSVLGSGGKLGGVSNTKTVRYDENDLTLAFLEACQAEAHGIFVSVDEVQKISQHDMSLICDAFQMASRKGFDVMLAIAGLPCAYDEVIHYEGCTYMRRAVHEELGLLTHAEVREAFEETFGRIKGLKVSVDALDKLVEMSFGHPYVMQLLGYHLVAWVNENISEKRYEVTQEDVARTAPLAIAAYERRALKPMVDVLPSEERAYLVAMSQVLDDQREAATGDVARALGKTPQQASRARQSLIKSGTIIATGRGKVMFNVPYLREYIAKDPVADMNAELVRRWRL